MNTWKCSLWLLLLAGLIVTGCARVSAPSTQPPIAGTPTLDSAQFLTTAEPPDARDVIAARTDVKDGEAVVLVGRIGGSKAPVSEERAMFTIVDLSLKSCDADPNCWDFA